MKKISILCLLLLIAACSSKKEGNMIVQGKIKGLKKGTLYLQKMQDSLLVSIDSVALLGKEDFELTDNVEEPILYYLTFDGNTSDKRILFFAEKGIITINDEVEKFGIAPKITGSKNQEVLDNYYKIARQFNGKRLDLIKESFEAKKEQDEEKQAQVTKKSENLIKRRYLYTTNYVLTHPDFEAAPYIALTELSNATLTLLDTIDVTLTDRVKTSTYGKKFVNFIKNIKANEE
jgi:hypothetical protein